MSLGSEMCIRDSTVVEQRAREELNLVREDEVYYQFVDEAPGPTGGGEDPQ